MFLSEGDSVEDRWKLRDTAAEKVGGVQSLKKPAASKDAAGYVSVQQP